MTWRDTKRWCSRCQYRFSNCVYFSPLQKNNTVIWESGTRLYFPSPTLFNTFCAAVLSKKKQENIDGKDISENLPHSFQYYTTQRDGRIIAMGYQVDEEAMTRGEIIRTTFCLGRLWGGREKMRRGMSHDLIKKTTAYYEFSGFYNSLHLNSKYILWLKFCCSLSNCEARKFLPVSLNSELLIREDGAENLGRKPIKKACWTRQSRKYERAIKQPKKTSGRISVVAPNLLCQ